MTWRLRSVAPPLTESLAPLELFGRFRWIDGRPLLDTIEPYRRRLFEQADERDADGRLRFNLVLSGRGKKNSKSADLILASLVALLNPSPGGSQCYLLANDEGQAGDDLELAKKLIAANPALGEWLRVRQKVIERRDGQGFLMILPAQDVAGAHGKTYRLCGFDEIHGYKTWDLLEAMQLDPTRPDAQMWITSYASIYHRPGVPLFDLCRMGRAGSDPRMVFSWYAADYTTDPDFAGADPETRANPSRGSWADAGYLEQQRRRLPAHKYRRLHLNLPGLPEGSAYQAESVMEAIDCGIAVRRPESGIIYRGFVDMSGGSNDDADLAIGYRDAAGRTIVVRVENQGPPPPFDPRQAVERFARLLKEYGIARVEGDQYAGQTFVADFRAHGIEYAICQQTKSQLYEALEPRLNAHEVRLPDVPILEQQLLGLVWRGGKIDHPAGEHDDASNAVAGVVALLGAPACPYCDTPTCSGLHILSLDGPPRRRARDAAAAEPAPDLLTALLAAAVEPEHDEVIGDRALEVVVGVAADASDAAGVVVVRDAHVVVLLRHVVGTAAEVEVQARTWASEFSVVEICGDERARDMLGRLRDVAPRAGERPVAGGQLREHLEAGQVVLYAAAGFEAVGERAARAGVWPPPLRALTVAVLAALARPEAVRR